ncbi:MAG: hypothetical protein ACR2IS_19495 [Nitrososphaeraceae archaeon]
MDKYKLSSQDSNEETTQIVNVHEGIVKDLIKYWQKLKTPFRIGDDIRPKNKSEIESTIRELEQKFTDPNQDMNSLVNTIGLLYNKIKNQTHFKALSIQLTSLFI